MTFPAEHKAPAAVAAATEASQLTNLVSNIPQELRANNNFLCWKLSPGENASLQKSPYNPINGTLAASKNPSTWTD